MRTDSENLIKTFKTLEHNLLSSLVSESDPISQGKSEQRIDLGVVFNTNEDPIHIVNFLDMDAKEGGVVYEKALNGAKHWHKILSGLIDQASGMEFSDDSTTDQTQEISTDNTALPLAAEELTKLSVLLDKRLITQEEFDAQKEKLLAGK